MDAMDTVDTKPDPKVEDARMDEPDAAAPRDKIPD